MFFIWQSEGNIKAIKIHACACRIMVRKKDISESAMSLKLNDWICKSIRKA